MAGFMGHWLDCANISLSFSLSLGILISPFRSAFWRTIVVATAPARCDYGVLGYKGCFSFPFRFLTLAVGVGLGLGTVMHSFDGVRDSMIPRYKLYSECIINMLKVTSKLPAGKQSRGNVDPLR